METGTFLQKDVIETIRKSFVPLKYKSGTDSDQFLSFDVSVMPTFILLDSEGNEISRNKGFLNEVDFINFLDAAYSDRDNV